MGNRMQKLGCRHLKVYERNRVWMGTSWKRWQIGTLFSRTPSERTDRQDVEGTESADESGESQCH